MHTKPPEKPDFGSIWAAFVKLAVQNMHFGCVTALLMYGDPCVTVTEPYIYRVRTIPQLWPTGSGWG
jgi:hypothetical protein